MLELKGEGFNGLFEAGGAVDSEAGFGGGGRGSESFPSKDGGNGEEEEGKETTGHGRDSRGERSLEINRSSDREGDQGLERRRIKAVKTSAMAAPATSGGVLDLPAVGAGVGDSEALIAVVLTVTGEDSD